MKKIFSDSEEKYLRSVVLYGHSDNYLYSDEKHTLKIDKDTLFNLCIKGLVVVFMDNTYYKPVFFKENSGHVEVTIATNVSSGASTSKILYSEEYSAD